MREVDISVVTFRPDLALLRALFASLAEPATKALRVNLLVHDNSGDPAAAGQVAALPELSCGAFARVDVQRSDANLGFGRGHNANIARASAPWLLLLNQDCVLESGALATLVAAAARDEERTAAWEMRQVPYEHPKGYDPVTMEPPWVSGAAVLLRRAAFDEARGFDPHFFLYGEDVDLSWRLRALGWKLRYVPRAVAVHRTYAQAGEVKPQQVFGSVYAGLALRARFGGAARMLQGVAMVGAELLAPGAFPGRRAGIAKAFLRFLAHAPHYLLTRVGSNERFRPRFSGWGYEIRREGAFHEVRPAPAAATTAQLPRVSILIRTLNRPAMLRHALASCAHQTYPNLEVVVVEDGGARAGEAVAREFEGRLDIAYRATGERVGRARAGNIALQAASGEWLNFLDDDDVFFADHVEVLLDAAQRAGVKGAYGLAWETQTEFIDEGAGRYEEVMHVTRHHQPFDRLTLWHHNYLPIQAVLFHRSLYERHGGFAEDMDQLEDWNLWTRYTLQDEFTLVAKTTSKYRIPAAARVAAERQALLDRAYADALERQAALQVTLSPREIARMAEAYVRGQSLMMVTRSDLRRFVSAHRILARVAAWRHPLRRLLRRRAVMQAKEQEHSRTGGE